MMTLLLAGLLLAAFCVWLIRYQLLPAWARIEQGKLDAERAKWSRIAQANSESKPMAAAGYPHRKVSR